MAMAFAAPAAEVAESAAPAVVEKVGAGGAAKKTAAKKPEGPSKAGSPSKGRDTKLEAPGPSEGRSKASKESKGKSTPNFGKKALGKIGNRKVLLPELILCLTVLVFGTLVAPKDSKDDIHRMVVKGSALMGVFFILAILSTGGKGAQKTSNVLGLLITLAYLLNSSDIHNVVNWVNKFFAKPKNQPNDTSNQDWLKQVEAIP